MWPYYQYQSPGYVFKGIIKWIILCYYDNYIFFYIYEISMIICDIILLQLENISNKFNSKENKTINKWVKCYMNWIRLKREFVITRTLCRRADCSLLHWADDAEYCIFLLFTRFFKTHHLIS